MYSIVVVPYNRVVFYYVLISISPLTSFCTWQLL